MAFFRREDLESSGAQLGAGSIGCSLPRVLHCFIPLQVLSCIDVCAGLHWEDKHLTLHLSYWPPSPLTPIIPSMCRCSAGSTCVRA